MRERAVKRMDRARCPSDAYITEREEMQLTVNVTVVTGWYVLRRKTSQEGALAAWVFVGEGRLEGTSATWGEDGVGRGWC